MPRPLSTATRSIEPARPGPPRTASALGGDICELELLLSSDSQVLSGSWKVDRSGENVFWSPENHTIYGTDPAAFVPTTERVHEMTYPDDRERVLKMAGAWRADSKPFVYTYRIVRPTGELRVVEVRGWVERDDAGNASGVLGTTTDVTRVVRDRLERDTLGEQRDVILRAAGDGICGLDRDGRITFSNPALLELLGRPWSSIDGILLHDLVHRDETGAEAHEPARCIYARRGDARTPVIDPEFRRPDGSMLAVACLRTGVDSERFSGAVLSFRDVTDRIRTLERVKSLSAQRGALLKSLVAAEENERSRIAADLHDDTVQTLSAVSLRLQRATAEAPDPVSGAALADAEAHVRAATMRMRFLLFELLPPVSERSLRQAIVAYCELLFQDSGVDFTVTGDPADIPVDCFLLVYRLAQEALRNVLKHSHGSRVQVRLESDGSELTVMVCDDGVGFGATGSGSSTAAGLRIVRQRAQAAGGSAQVGTGFGDTGAGVILRLPLRTAQGEPATVT